MTEEEILSHSTFDFFNLNTITSSLTSLRALNQNQQVQPRLFVHNKWSAARKNRTTVVNSNEEIQDCECSDSSSSEDDDDDQRNHNRREFSVSFPFDHIGDTGQFDYINATDKLELTIIPH